jgi:hypothetical protein
VIEASLPASAKRGSWEGIAMKRAFVIGFALCLGGYAVWAASPEVEGAVKTLKAAAADAGKLKTFCAMTKAMDEAGEKTNKETEDKIDGLMKQLGADFEKAWSVGNDLDDKSEDGKVYFTAVEDLVAKCPQ